MTVQIQKIKNRQDLQRVHDEFFEQVGRYRYQVQICAGAGCISCDCMQVKDALVDALFEAGLQDEVLIKMTGCMGNCDVGPSMIVRPGGIFYCRLKPENMTAIVQQHLVGQQVVEDLCLEDPQTGNRILHLDDIGFFNLQQKIVLRNCGKVDYESLPEYIANSGFTALQKVLAQNEPAAVVDVVKQSGLRGRGGGGFSTGLKWALGLKAIGEKKYLICNADEGDPGAFMDRSLLEGDPFGVIEGMAIAAFAIGAQYGFVYVRAEYPLAIERLSKAIEISRTAGLLGENIFDSAFCFDIQIRIGAGALVCGEETALMK